MSNYVDRVLQDVQTRYKDQPEFVQAVTEVLDAGWRTGDIKDAETPADKVVGTAKMGDLVVEHL